MSNRSVHGTSFLSFSTQGSVESRKNNNIHFLLSTDAWSTFYLFILNTYPTGGSPIRGYGNKLQKLQTTDRKEE